MTVPQLDELLTRGQKRHRRLLDALGGDEVALAELRKESLVDAEGIVRALASQPAPMSDPTWEGCLFCFAVDKIVDGRWIEATHADDCPWRLAGEWVASGDGQ